MSITPLGVYRVLFGICLYLELSVSDDFLNSLLEAGSHTYTIPLFRGLDRILTKQAYESLRLASQTGIALFIVSKSRLLGWFTLISYTALRGLTYIAWNNHYFLNFLLLVLFTFKPCQVPSSFRLLFSLIYFFAGVSKMSRGWLEGWVIQTLLDKHDLFPISETWLRRTLVYGGLGLDLAAGCILSLRELTLIQRGSVHVQLERVTYSVVVTLFLFHLTNFVWLFEAIHYFPLHMCCSLVLWWPYPRSPPARCSHKFMLVAVTVLAMRRFFIYPIDRANELAEFYNEHHEFSWRMKSKVYDKLLCQTLDSAHVRDVETLYQAVQHRKVDMRISCTFWLRVNGGPFVLLVDPAADLNSWYLPVIYFHPPAWPVLPAVNIRKDWRQQSLTVRARLALKLTRFRLEEFALHSHIALQGPSHVIGVYCLDEIFVNDVLCNGGSLRLLRGDPWHVRAGSHDSLFLLVFSQ